MKVERQSSSGAWFAGLLFALVIGAHPHAAHAAAPQEVHGSLDAYASPGLALAWAVLRGKHDDAEVVVRVDVDPAVYAALAVAGVDPFSRTAQSLVAMTPIGESRIVRLPRSRFADLPRTEWRFYARAKPDSGEAPALLVYYQGVPDTTPEFDDEAALSASLATRIERARREMSAKP